VRNLLVVQRREVTTVTLLPRCLLPERALQPMTGPDDPVGNFRISTRPTELMLTHGRQSTTTPLVCLWQHCPLTTPRPTPSGYLCGTALAASAARSWTVRTELCVGSWSPIFRPTNWYKRTRSDKIFSFGIAGYPSQSSGATPTSYSCFGACLGSWRPGEVQPL
jgi:hypothetical protein